MAKNMKPFVCTLTAEQQEWLTKGTKEMKLQNKTEFVRVIFDFVRKHHSEDLRKTLQRTQLEEMLKEADQRASEAAKERQAIADRLEKVVA